MEKLLIVARWFAWTVIAGLVLRRFSATRKPPAAAVGATIAVMVGATVVEQWSVDIQGASFSTFAICGVTALLFFEWRERHGLDPALSPKVQRRILISVACAALLSGALVIWVVEVQRRERNACRPPFEWVPLPDGGHACFGPVEPVARDGGFDLQPVPPAH